METKTRSALGEEAIAGSDLQSIVYAQIHQAAAPIATALNFTNLTPVNEGGLGDFPWFWQSGTNFNASTYNWLNHLFAYQDGYVGTNGQSLTTAYHDVLMSTSYMLDGADKEKLNKANLDNATALNTVITDWTSAFGSIPPANTTQIAQMNYIMTQVLTWGNPGLTLAQLRESTNPMALLPNIPIGASQLINDLMTYLANTSSVANIQAAVLSFNNQIAQARNNTDPQPPVTGVSPGFMQTIDRRGNLLIVPEVDIAESTSQIQNNLLPTSGTGRSFSASFTATARSSNTVQVSASGGASGVGDIDFFLTFSAEGSASYNMFSADSSLTSCKIELTYNGVTTITPSFYSYNVSTGKGWWLPAPIEEAANPVANQSGYQFNPSPAYNFSVNGNFGALSRLMISQQPIITLTYQTSNYSKFQEIFKEQSSWGISFLGIPLGGGSQSYFRSNTSFNSTSNTVTITMIPVGTQTAVSSIDQLANVVGAQILWAGASTLQNSAGV